MPHLPDPRRFERTNVADPLLAQVRRVSDADADVRSAEALALRREVERLLAAGEEDRLRAALAESGSARTYRALHRAIARAIDAPLEHESAPIARAFAIPLVFVAAASQTAHLDAALADTTPLASLFDRSGALGPTRSFGLSNALCTAEALERLSFVALYRSARELDRALLTSALPPADLRLAPQREATHLRFLVGAGITSADAPGFTETAANIGPWGRDLAKLVSGALAAPGVQILALPRAPVDLVYAPHAGRRAQLEAAFNLFASNAVRRLRAAVGEPVVILSAHDAGDFRVTLSSPFALDLVEGFSWPLHPLDELEEVEATLRALFTDMRVVDVRIARRVLGSERAGGVAFYPRSDDWEAIDARGSTH